MYCQIESNTEWSLVESGGALLSLQKRIEVGMEKPRGRFGYRVFIFVCVLVAFTGTPGPLLLLISVVRFLLVLSFQELM